MRNLLWLGILSVLFDLGAWGQEATLAPQVPQFVGSVEEQQPSGIQPGVTQIGPALTPASANSSVNGFTHKPPGSMPGARSRLSYYMTETYLNPSIFTAPAFRASMRMANPPGKGPSQYPKEWRQGAEGFGRNYGDAFATRIGTHTAQFLTGMLTGEDPNYVPSASHAFLMRSSHALAITFVDQTASGRHLPALSNFVGAAAGGFVGNTYLPDGFRDMTHAGQRATFQFGMLAAGNLFREFAPQMPGLVRAFIALIAR